MTSVANEVTVVAGILIPSTSPLFLTLVGVHVLFALVAVVAGAIAMLSAKRAGRHPFFGSIYYWTLAGATAFALVLSAMRWSHNYPLAILGTLSFGAALLGRTARRRRWRSWVRLHIASMGTSYVLMLIAFYVDNGKNLPLWKELPHIAYWLLPPAVGIPVILFALAKYWSAARSEAWVKPMK